MKSNRRDKPLADARSTMPPLFRRVGLAALVLLPVAAVGLVAADWWSSVPETVQATYVGRQSCIQCHQPQYQAWRGSNHDKAMDIASAETVLGNFHDATVEHHGLKSRMFMRDGKYFVHTEGPDGKSHDYEVKYVFGVSPLQQYMVELHAPAARQDGEIGRVQVLPIAWDSKRQAWFYLDPPDVHERLAADDPLHWTRAGGNWNYMCADCHSTNLQKNFNPQTCEYHTTFSEIDVSCEACHGPGSVHVQLAKAPSLFWDRKRGYGLAKLKTDDPKTQIETCAECHVRRTRVLASDHVAGGKLYDHFAGELINEGAYYADGQIRDEVYEHGSYIQSKMYHKGIRCTDCHDPHSTKVKFDDNRLCTTCHANTHPASKYDTPVHHHHAEGSAGAKCVNCHMPHTVYMEVDPRRDHSIRIPRPDLSVELGTPNACAGCHLDASKLSPEGRAAIEVSNTREPLKDYASWLTAAETSKDEKARQEVQHELKRLNAWSRENTRKWFGDAIEKTPHFASAFAAAWQEPPATGQLEHAQEVAKKLLNVANNREFPAMARASAFAHLAGFPLPEVTQAAADALRDEDPLVRYGALQYFGARIAEMVEGLSQAQAELANIAAAAGQQRDPNAMAMAQAYLAEMNKQLEAGRAEFQQIIAPVAVCLHDPLRLVRAEAGFVLSPVPADLLTRTQNQERAAAIDEYLAGLTLDNDSAHATTMMGVLQERMATSPADLERAASTHRQAIRVGPDATGPRANLADLLQRMAAQETDPQKAQKMHLEARELQREESRLLGRTAKLLPDRADVQVHYAHSLYLIGEEEAAAEAFRRAVELAPTSADILWQLSVIYQRQKKWEEALDTLERASQLAPQSTEYLLKLAELQAHQRKWQDAVSTLKKLVALQPQNQSWRQLLQQAEAAAKM